MNCQSVRSRLLALPDPAQVPAAAAAHFTTCPGCTAWHRLLTQVEAALASAPVPATDGTAKARVVARFRTAGKSRPKAPSLSPAPARPPFTERMAKLWPAGLIAAAVLAGTIAWLTFDRNPNGGQVAALPPDPLLDKVVTAKIDLDAAYHDPARKLQVLAKLGDDLHDSAQALALVTPGAEMDSLATLYASVGESMVSEARALRPDKVREALDPCIQGLVKIEQEASKKATEVPVGSTRPLLDIARVARKSRTELAKLL